MKTRLLTTLSLAFILISLVGCSNNAEPELYGNIIGQITDKESGEPIKSASVSLSPGGMSTVTSNDGLFEYISLDPEQYTLTVQMEGYMTNRKTITVIAGETHRADIAITKQK